MILKRNFYKRPTLEVAQDLLGCTLVRRIGKKEMRAMITEAEAYIGEDDLASHASRGRTPRTELMYGQAGHAYVYMVYGMHHCLNVVTEKEGFPAAVLIRSIAMEGMAYAKSNGPGKLCKLLEIDRALNGCDITRNEKLWIEKGRIRKDSKEVVAGQRIGVDWAKHCSQYPWRFTLSAHAGKKTK
jgi:DNA-3-methyladenine glycosylase